MPLLHAIAAMSENRVIGNEGKIPWHIAEDFRWFKHKTMGGTLIMGRKTFESIGKPLPGRETLVLSRNTMADGVQTCRSIYELDQALAQLPQPYWICGGADIYSQVLSKCVVFYLTRVLRTVSGDAFLPAFEHKFAMDQVIHENAEYRIERWRSKSVGLDLVLPDDKWPIAPSR